jgi:CheY-like chemotaxis protein
MNGPDATRAIRQFGYTGPIIGVTGNALDEDKLIFMNAGATNVIIKPLKMSKLLEIIDL